MQFQTPYQSLGDAFYERIDPTPVAAPQLLLWNDELGTELGLSPDEEGGEAGRAEIFSGNVLAPGSEPVALAYAGHQFGHFVPQLGDGRAHLLGGLPDREGTLQDVQLKGSGRTRFSRGGDGRCGLGPALREYIMSEALHALGVPTSRSLAVVATGETVYREEPQPGAVVTRIATSHLRVGTFEFFAARRDQRAVSQLVDYAVQRHGFDVPESGAERYLGFYDAVQERQIELINHWLRIGFIHGVMNTDNTAISGQTIDYGPCAMISHYHPGAVFSSIDQHGRYAFGNQGAIANWNLARLAECLIPLIHEDVDKALEQLNPRVQGFADQFHAAYLAMMAAKLGLAGITAGDETRIGRLLDTMQEHELDYTNTFLDLARALKADSSVLPKPLHAWFEEWEARVRDQSEGADGAIKRMAAANPVVIPRNHHVEAALTAAVESGDLTPAKRFLDVLRKPFSLAEHTADYQDPPPDGDRHYRTFCGT